MTRQPPRLRRISTIAAGTALGLVGSLSVAAPAQADGETVRLTAADHDIRDSAGRTWSSTGSFIGGTRSRTSASIAGTSDDELYRNERYGMSGFSRSVPNGTYSVTLKMAEIYWQAPWRRVFSVDAEGRRVFTDLDLHTRAGRLTAHDRTFAVTVTDGRLDLRFSARVNMPTVAALSYVRTSSSTTPTPPPPTGTTSGTSTGRPGAANTGVPTGTSLRHHWGDLTITTPGARYDSLDIHGFVHVKAPNVKITRSIVRGGVGRYSIGLVTNTTPTATGLVIEDSELVPEHPSVYLDGVKGANFTLRRVDVRGVVDNVKVHGPNVVVEHSWLHDSKHYSWDPSQGGGASHNDGVQVLGGRNLRIRNNTITGAHNAAVQVTQDFSVTTDLQVTGNYLDGGGCTVNLAHKRLSWMSGVTVSSNRFGRGSRYYDCAVIRSGGTSLSASGNVWDATGTAVRLRDGG